MECLGRIGISWTVATLTGNKSDDSSVGEVVGGEAFKHLSPETLSDYDLRWVPPWPSTTRSVVEMWRTRQRSSTMTTQSQVNALRFLELEVRGSQMLRSVPSDGLLGLIVVICRIAPLGFRFCMLKSDDCVEDFDPSMIWLVSIEWVVHYSSSLISGSDLSIYHQDVVLLALAWMVIWERIGSAESRPKDRGIKTFSKYGYAWFGVSVRGRQIKCIIGQVSKESALDRKFIIINLGLFSRIVCAVLQWLSMCLFSVLINTVHLWAKHVLAQCVRHYCPFSDWWFDFFSFCLLVCVFSNFMMNIALLEYIVVPRKLVRNRYCRCVPMEAYLVAVRIAKASLEGSCPIRWVCRPSFQAQVQVQVSPAVNAEDVLALWLCPTCINEHLNSCPFILLASLKCFISRSVGVVCFNSTYETL